MPRTSILLLLGVAALAGCAPSSSADVVQLADASLGGELSGPMSRVTLDIAPYSFADTFGDRYAGPVDVEIGRDPTSATLTLAFQGEEGALVLIAPITVEMAVEGVADDAEVAMLIRGPNEVAEVGFGDVQGGLFVGQADVSAKSRADGPTDELCGAYNFLLEVQGVVAASKARTAAPSSRGPAGGHTRAREKAATGEQAIIGWEEIGYAPTSGGQGIIAWDEIQY